MASSNNTEDLEAARAAFVTNLRYPTLSVQKDNKRRYLFLGAHIEGMSGDVYSGAIELGKTSVQEMATRILQPIYGYLVSNTTVTLCAAKFEIRATVISFNHTLAYDLKHQSTAKLPLPRRPYPSSTTNLGWKQEDKTQANAGIILVQNGYPAAPEAFQSRCLVAAFAISHLVQQAAFSGEAALRSTMTDLKCLSGQNKTASTKS